VDAVITQLELEQVLLAAHDASGPPPIDWVVAQPERVAALAPLPPGKERDSGKGTMGGVNAPGSKGPTGRKNVAVGPIPPRREETGLRRKDDGAGLKHSKL
jgi:hypothetical protein